MFIVGDIIICVNNTYTDLELNKQYNIIKIEYNVNGIIPRYKLITLNVNQDNQYVFERFISLKKYRKQKLININNESNK